MTILSHSITGCRSLTMVFAMFAIAQSTQNDLDAQTLETESWPLPMRVDHEDVATDLILEFSFERIESPFTEYNPGINQDRIEMDAFVHAIMEGDIENALDRTAIPQGDTREVNRELVEAFVENLSTATDRLLLERVVHVGQDRVLLWSLPTDDGGRYYRSFRFVRNENSQLQYDGVESNAMSTLITYAFQINQTDGFDLREPSEFDYDYVFPGSEGQPVVLRFDGEEIEVDAFNPLGETGNSIVDFFNQSRSVLANGTADEYAEYYSEYSEGRFKDWAAKQGSKSYESFRSDMVQYGARVVFVLDADPLHLVFYLPSDLSITGSPLRYQSIYNHPDTGLELTNFYVIGLAEAVLNRREYFEEPFLRPLLKSAGLIPTLSENIRSTLSLKGTIMPDPDEIFSDKEYHEIFDDNNRQPNFEGIDDIANESHNWVWYLGGALVIALTILALRKRK